MEIVRCSAEAAKIARLLEHPKHVCVFNAFVIKVFKIKRYNGINISDVIEEDEREKNATLMA